jgi:hypothetical protein
MDYFTHTEIEEVLSDIVPFQNYMLNSFGKEHITNDTKIHFDRITADKRIAVFVSPRVVGKARSKRGFAVDSYEPGYIRDKEIILPNHVFTRRPGEKMAAPMTPAQRYAATVVDLAVLQRERLYRRLELMATELLLDGSYRMKGEGIDVTVDFKRKAENTIVKTGANQWLDANTSVSPWDDIEEALNTCQVPIRSLVMGNAAWRYLKKDAKFDKMVYTDVLASQNSSLIWKIQQADMSGITYRGTFADSNIPIFTYTQDYTDPDTGVDTLYLPTDAVIGIPDAGYGWRAFASIQDSAADYMGMPYFFKNWEENEPGNPVLTLQSAPMLVHTKINSTFSIRTGATQTGA